MSHGVPEPPAPGEYGHRPGFGPWGPGPTGHEATGGYQAGYHQPAPHPGPQYHQHMGAPPGGPPKTYLAHNILGIFGCLSVLGIIGLVFGLQVSSKWVMGDHVGAHENARAAKILGTISLVGLVPIVLYVFFVLLAILLAIFA